VLAATLSAMSEASSAVRAPVLNASRKTRSACLTATTASGIVHGYSRCDGCVGSDGTQACAVYRWYLELRAEEARFFCHPTNVQRISEQLVNDGEQQRVFLLTCEDVGRTASHSE
jgi:hypothetical protein